MGYQRLLLNAIKQADIKLEQACLKEVHDGGSDGKGCDFGINAFIGRITE